jgi:hypothetical protein
MSEIFDIDAAGGVEIGVAMLGLWAVAWVIRQLILMIRESDDVGNGS